MQTDYIIVGQGICGTFLSYYLLKAGKKVIVIDDENPAAASKVASGVINPVTGRRIVKTWRIDELLPNAINAYTDLSAAIGASVMRPCALIDFHANVQMKEAFEKRQSQDSQYLQSEDPVKWESYFNFYYGAGQVSPCLLIDMPALLSKWKKELLLQNSFISDTFHLKECKLTNDCVEYKSISASAIIFCDGVAAAANPYFQNLPFAFNKGEAVIAHIPDLPTANIYKQGISIVPWQKDLYWIGSGYQWNYTDDKPTPAFNQHITKQLQNWLKLPFSITDHIAAVRPANVERRPFVGLHPAYKTIGILNGMGTKGCSLAPFFAKQLCDHLLHQKPIDAEADVMRFEKVLKRKIKTV